MKHPPTPRNAPRCPGCGLRYLPTPDDTGLCPECHGWHLRRLALQDQERATEPWQRSLARMENNPED